MGKVFICSDSYYERNLAYEIEFVSKGKIKTVYFLSENHDTRDNINIILEGNISECLNECDFVILSDDIQIPKNYSKKILLFNKSTLENSKICSWKKIYGRYGRIEKPTIVILSIGRWNDMYITEITVNKILSDAGIKIKQEFSNITKNITEIIYNTDPQKELNNISERSDIIILGISGIECNYIDLLNRLSKLHPDIIFACVNQSFDQVEAIHMYLSIVCRNVNIIRSPYMVYEYIPNKQIPVYCDKINTNNGELSTSSRYFCDEIKEKIYQSLYWPNEIRII